ncbi:MAG: phospho-N-acetylmuramoyl-pentapeptide-transferase [Syntrophobacterales bacterium]|nr:phospho-N-acetylmuramoyl-pentapeptide-transferase [Syntrophobacterales bacterium]
MLYWLGNILMSLSDIFSFCRLVNYITFRAIMAALTAVILVLICSKPYIMFLHRRRILDQQRNTGLGLALGKSDTPTMGGILIIGGAFFSLFLWGNLSSSFLWSVVFATTWFGALGFIDDLKKLRKRSGDKGLSEKTKLIAQAAFAVGFACYVTSSLSPLHPREATLLYVPFLKTPLLDLGHGFYTIFIILFVMFVTNAVNITDGLDGLAIMPSIFTISVLGVFAYVLGNKIYSAYLYYPYIPGSGELAIVAAALGGAGLGFLWYNTYPAQIFMGDTGSLALGGAISTMCVLLKQEMLFPILGGLFVAEALSSQIQDKIGVKFIGKRLFTRAPLHHALQYRGLAEPKVVVRLWIVSGILALIALATLKIR